MKVIEAVKNQGHGSCSPKYLFIHETANPGASAYNHSLLYARGYNYAVQYVSDKTGNVYHCVPDNRLAWAVGNGNKYGVNLEICHETNAADFKKGWDTAVTFVAWYLKTRGWTTANLMSHNECRLKWGGTDHTDPDGYFKKYGKTWADFKNEVKKKMEGTTSSSTSKPSTTTKPTTTTKPSTSTSKFGGTYKCTVSKLNIRTGPGLNYSVIKDKYYKKGQTVNLDNWYKIADGYVWGRYTGASSGKKRYVAVGKATGKPESNDFLVKVK